MDIELSTWDKKNNTEKALMVGMHGAPEIKHDEKIYYLGEFKERVLKLLTKKQVMEAAVYPEIIDALKDPRATALIIEGSSNQFSQKYKQIAKKLNKPYTVRSDPEFKGSAGLLVISNGAVEVAEITVPNRSVRLERLGISGKIINAAGKKICNRCFSKIIKLDPNEKVNYHELGFIDRLAGDSCPGHDE